LGAAISSRLRDCRRDIREFLAHLKIPAAIAREQRLGVGRLALGLAQAMGARTNPYRIAFERNAAHLSETNLRAPVTVGRARLEQLSRRLEAAARSALEKNRALLVSNGHRLDAVSPLRVLERGYSVVVNARDRRAVTDAAQVELGDELHIRLVHGRLRARTTEREI
jgi:exodeoxyribonuclease VII large subunit